MGSDSNDDDEDDEDDEDDDEDEADIADDVNAQIGRRRHHGGKRHGRKHHGRKHRGRGRHGHHRRGERGQCFEVINIFFPILLNSRQHSYNNDVAAVSVILCYVMSYCYLQI